MLHQGVRQLTEPKGKGYNAVSGVIATVFGSTGFLARNLISLLGESGTQIVAAYRGQLDDTRHLKPCGDLGQIVPQHISIRDESSIEQALVHSNAVFNFIGCRWPTKNFSLVEANVNSARTIAKVARRMGIERFVHISALSAKPDSQSEWARTKYWGEVAVREEFPNATILRPARIWGYEDRLLNKFGAIAARNHFPIFPAGYFQPISVT